MVVLQNWAFGVICYTALIGQQLTDIRDFTSTLCETPALEVVVQRDWAGTGGGGRFSFSWLSYEKPFCRRNNLIAICTTHKKLRASFLSSLKDTN
jgi:hypothetical protein